MKWCLVLAGIKDLSRPADKLSVPQNLGELSSIGREIGRTYPTEQPWQRRVSFGSDTHSLLPR